jgi:DNA modification methylase
MNIIKIDKQHDLEYSGFKLQKTGLLPIGSPTFEQWQECGQFIQKASGAVQLWLGDWLNYGEHKWGEKYAQAIEDTGLEYQTLKNAAWVAGKIDLSRRRDDLSYNHHLEVASLEPEQQDKVLDWAIKEGASTRDVRQKVKTIKRQLKNGTKEITSKITGQIIEGDCLDKLPDIKDKSIDLIYIDPPYNVGKDEWDSMMIDDYHDLIHKSVKHALRILKPNSHLFIHFPAHKASWLEQFILASFRIEPSSRIIWHYRNLVMGRDAKTKFLNTYQPILHYAIGDKPLNFNQDWNDERFDVWTIATVQSNFEEGKFHITQKPLELMERIVEIGSEPGDKVLDFFAGSGTTGIAAQKLNRDYILIEKNKEYINVIRQRLSTIH